MVLIPANRSFFPGSSCITLTRDNQLHSNRQHYFDLPQNEIGVQDGLLMLMWSGTSRLPFPDRQFDLVHSSWAIQNFSPDNRLMRSVLFDWDRVLQPNGLAVIIGGCSNALFDMCALLTEVAAAVGWISVCGIAREKGSHQGVLLGIECQHTEPSSVGRWNTTAPMLIFRKPL